MNPARLRALALEELRPAAASDRPEVVWPSETPADVIDRFDDAGAQAVAVLMHVREVEPAMTTEFLEALPPGATPEGLGWRVKSPVSLARKISDRVRKRLMSPAAAAEGCQDVVRYTAVATSSARLVPTAEQLVEGLQERGWSVLEAEQSYVGSDGRPLRHPYKGLHLIMKREAVVCEVQIHSPDSIAVKNAGHADYELERDDDQPLARRAQARADMERSWAAVSTPRGLRALSELGGVPVVAKVYPNPYR